MNATQLMPSGRSQRLRQGLLAVALGLFAALPAVANLPIPDAPLQSGATVPPNVWFILDDSGSMEWTCMPGHTSACTQIPNVEGHNIRLLTHVRNTIYYNPNRIYRPWRQVDGSRMSTFSYHAVPEHSTQVTGATIDLNLENRVFHVPRNAMADLNHASGYYRFTLPAGAMGVIRRCRWTSSTTWGTDCVDLPSVTWGGITRTAAEERQNFATWFAYHRTRMKVAKAGASEAFVNLGEDIRVGYTTIWNRHTFRIPVGTDDGRFRGVNRSTWFDRLHAADARSRTPLHSALANTHSYFTETGATGPWGPESGSQQLACRQNFTVLTTDGYWNENDGRNTDNVDNTVGPTITGPDARSYTYQPAFPFSDNWGGTLADQAMQNWRTDLRPDLVNNVPPSPANPAFWQHLVTFGISIGLRGSLDPATALPGLQAGTISWPNPMDEEDLHRIDDLFHAAVNGRGEFMVADDADTFGDILGQALATVASRTLSGSNVAINSTSIDVGTRIFQASYVGGQWSGELSAFPIGASGVAPTPAWRASSGIPAFDARRIFTWGGLVGQNFPTAAQAATLSAPVVDYLRGDRSGEIQNGGTLRNRRHLLGSIVHSTPIHDQATDTVFVGANDGMLHAFSGANGTERFAYVPAGLNFANLRTYANRDYQHRFFVDGPVLLSSRRLTPGRSVLVAALGRGGRGVFALDVTTPASFGATQVLWDKTGPAAETDMGLVLGRPVIARLNNGRTGLIIPNGVNSANHRAVLFIYDLDNGSLIARIDTGAGSAATPNGLSAPAVYDANGDGRADTVFAGDLLGNLWRFDISDQSPNRWEAAQNRSRLFAAGSTRPITAAPALALSPVDSRLWVFFGTGRYLTPGDPGNTAVQAWYGMRDSSTEILVTALQRRSIMEQVSRDGRIVRTFESASSLDATRSGWFIELARPPQPPGSAEGERMVTDQRVVGRMLIASSIIPLNDPCAVGGGRGFINAIDAFTGASPIRSFFDLDGDRDFADEVVGGRPIGSVDLNIGMPGAAALVEATLVVGGSTATIGEVQVDLSGIFGRLSWREIVPD